MQEHVEFAETLADAARTVILPYWRKQIIVEDKVENERAINTSPVTIADRAAELQMRKLIEEKYPTHGIYGEEFGNVRVDAEYVWVLDPIDGTKSFITGKPLFGTLIGLLHNGVPVVGVIDQCVLKERWVGAKGLATKLNGAVVSAKGCELLRDALMYSTTPHMFAEGEEQARFTALRQQVKRPLYGCDCYAYALLASGFGPDLVVEADLGLYDYCALVPVLLGAGAVMTDWNGEQLTLQNHEKSKGRVVAASNVSLHKATLGFLSTNSKVDLVAVLKKDIERLQAAITSLQA